MFKNYLVNGCSTDLKDCLIAIVTVVGVSISPSAVTTYDGLNIDYRGRGLKFQLKLQN